MKNFNREGGGSRGGFGGGDRKFGGGDFKKKSFGGGSRGGFGGDRGDRPEMHKAICADCGAACEVPFKPNGKRPVLCSNCFKGSDRQESGDRRDGGRREERRFGDKQMFQAVCSSCGNDCEVPFKPSGSKPVYCSNCFEKEGNSDLNISSPRNDRTERHEHKHENNSQLEARLEAINLKLEKIFKLLSPSSDFVETSVKTPKEIIPKELEISAPKKSEKVVKESKKTVETKKVAKKVVKKPAKKVSKK